MFLLAQRPAPATPEWLGYWVIVAILIAGLIGILLVCLQEFGIAVPAAIRKILWIVIVLVVAIVAVRFILSL